MGPRNGWIRRGTRRLARPVVRRPSGTAGFSLLELVIVLVIGGILAAVAVGGMGGIQARMGVRSAESGFLSMHAQTRAFAVERGIAVSLTASPGSGMVEIREGCDGSGTIVQSRNFRSDYGVTLDTGGETLALCMTPRGYASPAGNSFDDEGRVTFERGEHARTVRLRPLGQAVRQ